MAGAKNKVVDVLIIGDGLAGCTAALAAQKERAEVMIIEKSRPNIPHGNTAFCGGALRRVSATYPAQKYFDDIMKVSNGKANPTLTKITIQNSQRAKAWLRRLGIPWTRPSSNPGRADAVLGRGPVLESVIRGAVRKVGIPVLYETAALGIVRSDDRIRGVKVKAKHGSETIACKSVILATGGFQGNGSMVKRYLGKGADRLVLRGYKGNTGDGHQIASKMGATLVGMEGYHGGIIHVGYKQFPAVGRKKRMRSVKRYERAILVNKKGERFVDEGEDTADKTYAKFGRIIALTQPGGVAYLIFDSKSNDIIDPMYEGPKKGPVAAATLEDLAKKLSLSPRKLRATVHTFNSSISDEKALGLTPPKTNFAQRIDTPPFYAYPATGGMTFTFGGVKINEKAEVLDSGEKPIPGFYAAGEVTGGFFYNNYPAGSSLTRCVVFGEIAGKSAASYAGSASRKTSQ
jgi:tricarballylate dehydrogenase